MLIRLFLGNYEFDISQDDPGDEYDYHNRQVFISKDPQQKR